MKSLDLKYGFWGLLNGLLRGTKELYLLAVLIAGWFALPGFLNGAKEQMGFLDQSILLLLVLALIGFLLLLGLCWWLLQRFWRGLGLPGIGYMVLQFKELSLWQQLGFYWACFALLLLAGVGCLAAIC